MRHVRIISIILAAVLTFCIMPFSALAAMSDNNNSARLEDFSLVLDYSGAELNSNNKLVYTRVNPTSDADLNPSIIFNCDSPYNITNSNIDFSYLEEGSDDYVIKVGIEDHTEGDPNTYLQYSLLNSYKNARTATGSNYLFTYKGYQQYAGRTLLLSMDIKLDALVTDENASNYNTLTSLIQLMSTWLDPSLTTGAHYGKPIAINSTTGKLLYSDAGGKYQESDVTLSTTSYKTVALLFDFGANTYSIYVDGQCKVTAKYLSDTVLATIVGDSEGDTSKRKAVDVTGLTEEEAYFERARSYTLTQFRLFQDNGYITYYIDNLRLYAYNQTTVNGYDLTIDDGVLGLNYYLDLNADVLADSTATVDFAIAGGETVSVPVKDAQYVDGKGYKFTVPVSSVEMAKDITMTINGEGSYYVYKNGVAYPSNVYSVKAYAEKLLNDATYGNIAKAMLNYGAYAQTYFAAKNESVAGTLANENCAYTTELDSVTIDVADPTQTGTGKKVAKLILDTTTSIVIYDGEGNKIGEKTGINSLNLDTAYEIDCGASGKVTVSVLAIGEKVLASGTASAEFKALIKALKLFSDASETLAN